MTKGTALTRKDMKGPDKFQAAAAEAAEWATRRQKQLMYLAIGVVAVVAIGVAIESLMDRSSNEAGRMLYAALSAADGVVSPAPVPGATSPTFTTVEEQQKAVLERAEEVRREHGSSAAGRTAALAAGDAQLRLGQWDAAITSYEQFLDKASKDDSLRFSALEGLAFAQEGKGDLDRAAQTLERLATEAPRHSDRATLERARVLAKAGKVDDAKKLLASFPEQHKDSPLLQDAQQRLARLGGK